MFRRLSARLVLFFVLTITACGARSGRQGDSGYVPPPPRADGGVLLTDSAVPVDSCLPIAASRVQGTYAGTWTGTWSCPGLSQQSVSGSLTFELRPSGAPESFSVAGQFSGVVDGIAPPIPIRARLAGNMGCTALTLQLLDLIVDVVNYRGTGTLKATYVASPRGFPSGSWVAKETTGSGCSGTGTWKATFAL